MAITINLRYVGANGSAIAFANEMMKSGTVAKIRAEDGNLRYEYYQSFDFLETVLLIDCWMIFIWLWSVMSARRQLNRMTGLSEDKSEFNVQRIVEEANRLIHKRKSVLRVILGIMAAIAFVFACLLGDLIYATRFKINPVDKSIAPDGTYELSFQQVGDPDWPFGYTHARLVLKNGKRVIIKQTFDIADDGANASINSWNVDWKDISVEVVISGTEQDDVLYVLKFDGSVDRKQLDTRYGHIKEERTRK